MSVAVKVYVVLPSGIYKATLRNVVNFIVPRSLTPCMSISNFIIALHAFDVKSGSNIRISGSQNLLFPLFTFPSKIWC